ncbi:MAG: nitrogen regulation protein NR(I) [Burkholderiaceae bacterium]|nr:nitrogen regulation protein NR(I) [Burkholderiales bacterium]MCZ8106819.1 nitrogen regulation protein NR(I) [Burkholderiales bacterium]MCZ8337355.1 nitrogen regulation protein NR(I) [Burkholderiaceae bacterium]
MDAVWIVDDDQSIRWVLERALSREGFDVRVFGTARDCLSALELDSPRVLVSDIRMPGESGIELLQQVKQRRPGMPVIIMTAFSDLDSAVSAFQGGAFEYLPKPFDLPKAIELIRRAVAESEREAAADETLLETPEMMGQAPAMQEVFRAIGRLSQSNVTVMITGESGSGKELIARALHKHSPRGAQPFVALNTAAIPRDLLESELFGHERGAFTGAQQMRRGRFEQAEGGTLFLDEIGDMPAELQTRLLRVLSDGHFYRVGGHQPLKANVRVIAATHQNLEERVRQGLFREDLFHRLNVIRLRLPPLRERVQDVPLLARHFIQRSARELGVEAKRLSDEALARLASFSWPGNVRQLENVCHWLTVMAPAQTIEAKDLPPDVLAATQAPDAASIAALAAAAQPAVAHAIEAPGGVFAGAPAPVASVRGDAHAELARPVPAPSGAATSFGAPPSFGSVDPGYGGARAGAMPGGGAVPAAPPPPRPGWASLLEAEVAQILAAQSARGGEPQSASDVMEQLTRTFESTIIKTALRHTRGRRIDAALRLGIGRNTITRKIQDLGLEED